MHIERRFAERIANVTMRLTKKFELHAQGNICVSIMKNIWQPLVGIRKRIVKKCVPTKSNIAKRIKKPALLRAKNTKRNTENRFESGEENIEKHIKTRSMQKPKYTGRHIRKLRKNTIGSIAIVIAKGY